MNIPFSRPTLTEDEEKAVVEILRSGWLTVGNAVKQFEDDLKSYTGARNVVAVDSCTTALTISARVLKDYYGISRVVIPALTFVATANAMRNVGLEVEFVDVDRTGCVDFSQVSLGKAVVPVTYAGQPISGYVYNDYIIVEDSAHSIGSYFEDYKIGSFPNVVSSCFSFYPTKNMTTIEGGAIMTPNDEVAVMCRELSLHGLSASHITRYERSSTAKPTAKISGYKANMTNVEASIGIQQLKKLDGFIARRKELVKVYQKELENYEQLEVKHPQGHSWHMFIILVPNRDDVLLKLKEKGINAGVHYYPTIPNHPAYFTYKKFPVAEYISEHCISLPLFPTLTDEEQDYVIKTVKEIV